MLFEIVMLGLTSAVFAVSFSEKYRQYGSGCAFMGTGTIHIVQANEINKNLRHEPVSSTEGPPAERAS
jgi:hypothetical protein